MEKEVLLSITGSKYSDDGEDDTVELITEGSYSVEDGKYTLRYKESALSGMEGSTTILTVEDGMVTMQREGTLSSHFVFKNNQFFQGNYSTPAGIVQVGVFPIYVDYRMGEEDGQIDLEYRLDVAGIESYNQINVIFSPKYEGLN